MKTSKMKMITMGMAMLMAFSLTGCGSSDTGTVQEDTQKEETQEQNEPVTEASLMEKLSLKDVTYDVDTATITGTIVNDNDTHINYVILGGTVAYAGDEIESGECSIDGSTPQDINFISDSGNAQEVPDIDANSEKQFTLTLSENGNFGALRPDPALISQPQLKFIDAFSDELAANPDRGFGSMYVMPKDYEVNFNYDAEQGSLTIQLSNNSDYVWTDPAVWVRYTYDGSEQKVEEIYFDEVDKGSSTETVASRLYKGSDFNVKCVYTRVEANE